MVDKIDKINLDKPKYFKKFKNPFIDKFDKTEQDCSQKEEDVYVEIEPYAIDETTGEVLNKTNKKILKHIGKKNFYDEIQSHADEVDIYKIIERAQRSGDTSLFNVRQAHFDDYVTLPDNINELVDIIRNLPPEQKEALSKGGDSLNKLIEDEVKKALIEKGVVSEEKPKEVKKDE